MRVNQRPAGHREFKLFEKFRSVENILDTGTNQGVIESQKSEVYFVMFLQFWSCEI